MSVIFQRFNRVCVQASCLRLSYKLRDQLKLNASLVFLFPTLFCGTMVLMVLCCRRSDFIMEVIVIVTWTELK